MLIRSLVSLQIVILSIIPTFADVITLKDGRVIEGKLVSETKTQLKLETFDGEITVKKSEIKEHSRNKSRFEIYQEKLEKIKTDSADDQCNIAQWCKEQGLLSVAKKHTAEALKIDSKSKKAQDLEKAIKDEVQKLLVPLTLKVGVKQQLKKQDVEKLAEQVKKMSSNLAKITGGTMYLESVTFDVGSTNGDFVYDKDFSGIPNGGTNIPFGPSHWHVGTLLHEFGHARLGLADEYDTSKYGVPTDDKCCDNCIMALKLKCGFCNKSNHKGRRNEPGCQEILMKQYPQLVKGFARTGSELEELMKLIPEMKVVINGLK